MMRHDNRASRSRGQSLVEFALVLPVVLMLLMGVLDLGRGFYIQLALRDAADEGAVYASIRPTDETGIKERTVDASTVLFAIDPDTVSVVAPTVAVGAPITVTIAHQMQLYTPFVQGLAGGSTGLTITGAATHSIITP